MEIDKSTQGKRNRLAGADFERRTKKHLQEFGWIVDRWTNNVELPHEKFVAINENQNPCNSKIFVSGKCIPAKSNRFNTRTNGFPDFFAYKLGLKFNFIECKINGRLDKTEKLKAQWYLDNNYCDKFFIAYKTIENGKVHVNLKEFNQSNQ